MPGPIKGSRVRIEVTALDEEGAGVGRSAELRLHVPLAIPGDTIDAVVLHRSPHRPEAWGELIALHAPSPDRVAPACRAFGRCGGCLLQQLAYPRQLEWKRERVAGALAAAGPRDIVEVAPCVPSPRRLGYRNNARLVFAPGGAGVMLGAYAPRSHTVVDLDGCRVVEPPLDEVAGALAAEAGRLGIVPYDEASGGGEARYAILRSNAAGRVLALLVVPRAGGARIAELARALRGARPEVVGVVENLQPARGNALVGRVAPDRILDGEGGLDEQVGPVSLRLSPRAFFQSNREVAARLYADVAAAAALASGERAIDVYSGAGGIALTLARGGADVLGIEENPEAVAGAESAARASGARARFIAGDAAAALSAEAAAGGPPVAAIVVDPPRGGCRRPVLEALAALAPRRLLYVSCEPTTLARDLALLATLGYRATAVTPYDMLPHTPHVETLVTLAPHPG